MVGAVERGELPAIADVERLRESRLERVTTTDGETCYRKDDGRYTDPVYEAHRVADAVTEVLDVDTYAMAFDPEERHIYMEDLGPNLLERTPGDTTPLTPAPVSEEIDKFYDAVATKRVLQDYDAWSNIHYDGLTLRPIDFDYATRTEPSHMAWHLDRASLDTADVLGIDYDPAEVAERAEAFRQTLLASEDAIHAMLDTSAERAVLDDVLHDTPPHTAIEPEQ